MYGNSLRAIQKFVISGGNEHLIKLGGEGEAHHFTCKAKILLQPSTCRLVPSFSSGWTVHAEEVTRFLQRECLRFDCYDLLPIRAF